MKKSLDERILNNMLNKLNICKAKQSVLRAKGLSSAVVTERIEFLEQGVAAQRKKIEEAKNSA